MEGKETELKFAINPQSFKTSYGAGGEANLALTILTGQRSKEFAIDKSNPMYPFDNTNNSLVTNVFWRLVPKLINLNTLKEGEPLSAHFTREFQETSDKSGYLKNLIAEQNFEDEKWKNSLIGKILDDKNLLIEWVR